MDPCLLPETLMGLLKTPSPPVVIDVRKRPAFETDPVMLPRAVWRDPQSVERWATELPSGCSVVAYCVHGHEVSRGVRDALRRRGVMAGIIEGGIEGWRAAGGSVVPEQRGDGR
jgi:rhodanese-related sulfurtransferase